jgi:hypothetical protein
MFVPLANIYSCVCVCVCVCVFVCVARGTARLRPKCKYVRVFVCACIFVCSAPACMQGLFMAGRASSLRAHVAWCAHVRMYQKDNCSMYGKYIRLELWM